MEQFRFLMLSAMNENGGNTTHRLLDGHPNLFTYPFESQTGTRFVSDHLAGMYPAKYRWPLFPAGLTAIEYFELIIDEETKILLRTPHVSKFRDAGMECSEEQRRHHFCEYMKGREFTRANLMAAFFVATFDAWTNFNRSGQEQTYVGYNPIIVVDGQKIIEDYQGRGYVLHVVRNPFSAYADRKKRPTQQSVAHYALGWQICIQEARACQRRFPDHCFILHYEDIIVDPVKVLGEFLGKIGHGPSPTLAKPTWNGKELPQVYPWGTIRTPTPAVNEATANELSAEEKKEMHDRLRPLLEEFNYLRFAK